MTDLPNSAQLRAIVVQAESEAATTGARLIQAEHAHKLAIRSALVSGDHAAADVTALEAEAARNAHQRATASLTEARALFTEAVAAERADRLAKLREDVESCTTAIAAAAGDVDTAYATLLGKLALLRRLDNESRTKIRDVMPGREPIGSAIRDIPSDIASHLRSIASGNPANLEPFASVRAGKTINQLRAAVAGGD